MKVEYLPEGSADCPLIRIFGTSPTEFSGLRSTALLLNRGGAISGEVQALEGFHLVNFGRLTMTASEKISGVQRVAADGFNWLNSKRQWALVAGLLEPFSELMPETTHQWLCGKEALPPLAESEISIVVSSSPKGTW